MSKEKRDAGTAVWYFVAATFVVVIGPLLLAPGPGHWLQLFWIGFGILLILLGSIVWICERRKLKESTD
jgi:hypothetical protein